MMYRCRSKGTSTSMVTGTSACRKHGWGRPESQQGAEQPRENYRELPGTFYAVLPKLRPISRLLTQMKTQKENMESRDA